MNGRLERPAAVAALATVLLAGCSGLGREINQALPQFLRADPGAKEKEIFAQIRRAREWTPEELEEQKRRYDEAVLAMEEERFDDAASILEDYVEDYPVSSRDEEARFRLGRSFFEDDDYGEAFSAFEDFSDLYVVSDYSDDVAEYQYRMGKAYIEGERSIFLGIFSNRSKGEDILNHVVERHPNSRRAPDAQWLLANYYLDEDEWAKAAGAFSFLADNYKDSEWFGAARYYEAYALNRLVKGAKYDPRSIRRARRAFETYLREVPEGRWREDARALGDRLEDLEAEHWLELGEWYIGMGKPYSARYYLEIARVRYPGTPAAERAAELLQRDDVVPPEERAPPEPPASRPPAPEGPGTRPAPGEGRTGPGGGP